MKTYPLLIPKKIILPISVLGFIITVIGSLFKLSHWSFGIFTPKLLLSISIVFSLFAIFVVSLDIIKNPIKNNRISVFSHNPVILGIISLSKSLSPKYLRFSL